MFDVKVRDGFHAIRPIARRCFGDDERCLYYQLHRDVGLSNDTRVKYLEKVSRGIYQATGIGVIE